MEINYDNIIDYYKTDIKKILKNKNRYYHSFDIPKRSGGKRRISEPSEKLKHIQRILYDEIFRPKKYLIHKCAYAYVPGRDIKECVEKHVGKAIVVKLDITGFFSSITTHHISDTLKYSFGMSDDTAKTITKLCTLNGVLPQSATTSPIISNFVCRKLDRRLFGYCSKHDIEYTRYADDLIFSGDFNPKELIGYVSWALRDYYGFRLNYDKLRIMRKHQQQVVLGLLVNQQCRLTKEKRHELRQTLYYAQKYGVADYLRHTAQEIQSLMGYVDYAVSMSGEPFIKELQDLLRKYVEEKK